jgi:hypothetical protein
MHSFERYMDTHEHTHTRKLINEQLVTVNLIEDTSSEDMIEPGHLGREPNVCTNECVDDYGFIQDAEATNMKSIETIELILEKLKTALTEIFIVDY